jgi:hypothetical protein
MTEEVLFTFCNTEGYSQAELDKLNKEWRDIIKRENLEPGTYECHEAAQRLSDEVSGRNN